MCVKQVMKFQIATPEMCIPRANETPDIIIFSLSPFEFDSSQVWGGETVL